MITGSIEKLEQLEDRVTKRLDNLQETTDEKFQQIENAVGGLSEKFQQTENAVGGLSEKLDGLVRVVNYEKLSKREQRVLETREYLQGLRRCVYTWLTDASSDSTKLNRLTKDANKAVVTWVDTEAGDNYMQVALLSRGSVPLDKLAPLLVAVCSIPTFTRDFLLFRGVRVRGRLEDFLGKYAENSLVLEPNFIACTSEVCRTTAFTEGVHHSVLFVLKTLSARPLQKLACYKDTQHSGEREWLIPPGSLWEVEKVTDTTNHKLNSVSHVIQMKQIASPTISLDLENLPLPSLLTVKFAEVNLYLHRVLYNDDDLQQKLLDETLQEDLEEKVEEAVRDDPNLPIPQAICTWEDLNLAGGDKKLLEMATLAGLGARETTQPPKAETTATSTSTEKTTTSTVTEHLGLQLVPNIVAYPDQTSTGTSLYSPSVSLGYSQASPTKSVATPPDSDSSPSDQGNGSGDGDGEPTDSGPGTGDPVTGDGSVLD
eukprot:TRINITY_DN67565_c9_g2_i3.p1 TRINITY_DN67565_c9_g2~~TRINITY_DN67565_c9_g2_i3.p1  ORF type:complete len:525 (-),score=46.77 TRINITY_DN67565_c9_g2_i3:518-1975(-)